MRRFFFFLILLAIVAGAGYWWWEQHSARVLGEEVRILCSRFVVNPDDLDIKPTALQITGLREGRVASVAISGKNIELANGPTLAEMELQVKDLTIEGPPFRLTSLSGGTFRVVVRDKDVTSFIQNRGIRIAGMSIPMKQLSVAFSEDNVTTVKLTVAPPLFSPTTISASGKLQASSQTGKVDFAPDSSRLAIGGTKLPAMLGGVSGVLNQLNPVINTDDFPFICQFDPVVTQTGKVTLTGKLTDIKPQFGF